MRLMSALDRAGIATHDLTTRLLDDGVSKFSAAFDSSWARSRKTSRVLASALDRMSLRLPKTLDDESRRARDAHTGKVRRLWARDGVVVDGSWREPVARLAGHRVRRRRRDPSADDVRHGGSGATSSNASCSEWRLRLCSDVLSRTFGRIRAGPSSTSSTRPIPRRLRALESRLDLSSALYRSSKSGTRSSQPLQGLLPRPRLPDTW